MKKSRIILIVVLSLVLVCVLLVRCNVGSYRYDNGRRYTAGGAAVSGRVEQVDVNWIAGRVTIGTHDGNDVLLSESTNGRLKEEKQLHWWLDDGKLSVKFAASGARLVNAESKELTVLLPERLALDELKISVVSARVEAEDVNAEIIRVDTVSGPVTAEMEQTENVKVNSVSGNVELSFAREPEKITVDTVSGRATIALPENAGVTAELDSVSGRVRGSFGAVQQGDRLVAGDGDCEIKVNTVSGDLYLNALDD